ncbi:MAG: DEAD/DEAH box helicase [Chloroflexi bacterium]|nr:DEAD/DEAH box helicase [Chloroflexota bacterium]
MKSTQANPAVLSLFHPAVARWFASRFARPTGAQERGWPAIRQGKDTLIAAPTGSGKTLAAFLNCIDTLVRQGLEGRLQDETQVLYVSPLKALSNDVQKNLAEPLSQVRDALMGMGLPAPDIRVMVRTGDTPASERLAMTKRPPHILVTTPESMYILLTSKGGRAMLKTVATVIVDEIHAVARDRRGAHLALSLERLDALTGKRPVRIGLSATQRPIEEVARFLVGTAHVATEGTPACTIIDEGHVRVLDLALELPGSPLTAVMSYETWEEIYDRLAELIRQHKTTLVFSNTRRLAERVSLHLAKRLGEGQVTSHHGSLSREQRLTAEQRLKAGELKALVATASLELGIDIGAVDLVCQLASPRSVATFLQRVGRSGHSLGATPKGRLFPLTRDELIECTALLRAVKAGTLDRLTVPQKPLDVLAQQIVAASAVEEWSEDALYELAQRAYTYRDLTRDEFDQVVRMLADGFSTRRGRSGAHLHYDGVGKRLRGRRSARLAAITSGGAIPENADYQVVLEPQGTPVGTVNEDFAIESMADDIFQLGISSWRILKVEQGKVRVEDAHGQPPTIPFWLGEAPARTFELSAEVSRLREEIEVRVDQPEKAIAWLVSESSVPTGAAEQIVEYLAATKAALGAIPSQKTIVLERFFDETGGMQLVLHAPFGGRINRAWGLTLRKRFCRMFNQELQAAATEDSIVLSLGPQHSFPLADVFQYLRAETVEPLLVQAVLAAPVFTTRWRWNVTRSLAVLRQEKGRKVPMPLQRMRSDDLMTAVFPDQVACAENLQGGDIAIPDHPLVRQTIDDCLHEAMDIDGLKAVLRGIEARQYNLIAKDTVEPSPMAHEILTAKPYAFLDDAPLEERRTQAVMTRRSLDVQSAQDLGALDAAAVERVRDEAWPQAEDADELHDALVMLGAMTEEEASQWDTLIEGLAASKRAARIETKAGFRVWVAAERLPQWRAVVPEAKPAPVIEAPAREASQTWEPEEALREIVRGRMEGLGPVTAVSQAQALGLPLSRIEASLVALEAEGFVLRGRFTPGVTETEWCERRLLARIHRYTLDRLRKEIEPVTAQDFMRFLLAWQHAEPEARLQGTQGLAQVVEQLQGYQSPAGAWEAQVLPARMQKYVPAMLDELCWSGLVTWGRLFPATNGETRKAGPTKASPIALLYRERLPQWLGVAPSVHGGAKLSGLAKTLRDTLDRRGASFTQDLVSETRRLPSEVRNALGELVTAGLVTGDGFGGLRSLVSPGKRLSPRPKSPHWLGPVAASHGPGTGAVGRWSLLRGTLPLAPVPPVVRQAHHKRSTDSVRPEPVEGRVATANGATYGAQPLEAYEAAELWARQLLRRYGVVFHRLVVREVGLPPWRDLLRVFRRLEARGEIRGGRMVAGFSGEQYALPEAVESLRAVRRRPPTGALVGLCGADPLNLVGIIVPGERVPALAANRIVYRDGLPVATRIAGAVAHHQETPEPQRPAVLQALRG